jgi:phage terminase small subunit
MAQKKIKRADILTSLKKQLALKGAALSHYEDLLSDYMELYDVKNKLVRDIKKRGVTYQDYSAAGKLIWKNNPSVKELTGVSRQMLAILKELKLSTDEAGGEVDDL